MQVRINGEWKEYDVEQTADGQIICEALQKDWSLSIMQWVHEIRIEHYHDLRCNALFGYYEFDGMKASDILFFRTEPEQTGAAGNCGNS